jgi:hypothetical protein
MGVSWLLLTRIAGTDSKRNAIQETAFASYYEGMRPRTLVCVSARAKS